MHNAKVAFLPIQRQSGQPVHGAIWHGCPQRICQGHKPCRFGCCIYPCGDAIADQRFGPARADPAFAPSGGIGQKIQQHAFVVAHQADMTTRTGLAQTGHRPQHSSRLRAAINQITCKNDPGSICLRLVCNLRQHRVQQPRHPMYIADDAYGLGRLRRGRQSRSITCSVRQPCAKTEYFAQPVQPKHFSRGSDGHPVPKAMLPPTPPKHPCNYKPPKPPPRRPPHQWPEVRPLSPRKYQTQQILPASLPLCCQNLTDHQVTPFRSWLSYTPTVYVPSDNATNLV